MISNNMDVLYRKFETRAAEIPNHVAVVSTDWYNGNREITHHQLKEEVDRMSDRLTNEGVKPGDIIGVITGDTIETVIHVLGIIKAGGVYLPIHQANSKSTTIPQLQDLGVSKLVTETGDLQKFSFEPSYTPTSIKEKPFITESRPSITNLDNLPIPDRSLINYEKYHQFIGHTMVKYNISMQATRGCPYHCAYCHRIWPRTHAYRSAENLFSEVKLYYDMGVRRFSFVDDVFNLNIRNCQQFFELILKNQMKVQFFFPNGLRGDLLTREYIDLMIRAGTVMFSLALETASPRLQKLIGKNMNIEKLKENIEYICQKYPDVILEIFLMTGFPTETEEDALDTLKFLKSIRWAHFAYLSIVRIYGNTDMEKLALANGISQEAINSSQALAYHDIPNTLPFSKDFMFQYKSAFLYEFFLAKERLLHVLPYQMKLLTEDELVQKYNSYLPVEINSLTGLLELAGIKSEEMGIEKCVEEEIVYVPDLNQKMRNHFGEKDYDDNALRILLLDLSQFFSAESNMLFDVVETPLGLMYLLTYLEQCFGPKVRGKIAKSRIDFNNYGELKRLIDEFAPQVIGIRTLTFYRDFFHKTVARLRQWGVTVPVICGGPYATSDYQIILQDGNIDLVVLGEGEVTFSRLIRAIIEYDGALPNEKVLKQIPGLAFIRESEKSLKKSILETGKFDEYIDYILQEIAGGRVLNLQEINMLTENEKKQLSQFYIEKENENYDF